MLSDNSSSESSTKPAAEPTAESPTKPHPNDNVEILYKPYIKVHSDYESDTTPRRKDHKEHVASPAIVSCTEFRSHGFKHSWFHVDQEALLYTTLD